MTVMEPDTDDQTSGAPGRFRTFRLARVQAKLNAQSSRILKEQAGITLTQWRLLALIGNAGRTTAAHLSREVAMDKGLISRNIKTMVTDGLILITVDPGDNRAQHLELTDVGQRVFHETLPRMRARQDALRALLDLEEEHIFDRVLTKLDRVADDRSYG